MQLGQTHNDPEPAEAEMFAFEFVWPNPRMATFGSDYQFDARAAPGFVADLKELLIANSCGSLVRERRL